MSFPETERRRNRAVRKILECRTTGIANHGELLGANGKRLGTIDLISSVMLFLVYLSLKKGTATLFRVKLPGERHLGTLSEAMYGLGMHR